MKNIIIVGATGSGKSTLAMKLQKKLKLPYIQLDQLFWKPGWQWSTDDEFFPKIEIALTENKNWIIDGNYNRTNHLTWPKADTIIWIDLPFSMVLYQSLVRAIKRSINGDELWPNTGNKESFQRLFSKDSIIRWLFKTYPIMKERYSSAFTNSKYKHINFIRLTSRKQINDFLGRIE